MQNIIPIEEGIAWTAGKRERVNLPLGVDISNISIRSRLAPDVGNLVANTTIVRLELEIDGQTLEDWYSDVVADKPSWAMLALREFNSQKHGRAETAEYFELELPDALPPDVPKTLYFTFNSVATNCSDGAATTMTGSVDVYITVENELPDVTRIRKVQRGVKDCGSTVSITKVEKMPAIQKGFGADYLVLITTDNSAVDNTALGKITLKDVKNGNKQLRKGYFTDFQHDQSKASHLAASTGICIIPLDHVYWDSDQVELEVVTYSTLAGSVSMYWFLLSSIDIG